jgi:EAL domain-containing protein (putative c-di-GMP-specific phosphodiesterase class I)
LKRCCAGIILAWAFCAPDKFIRIAEETGQIVPIGRWVLQQACLQIANWMKMGFGPFRVAVNVSARQFAEPNFVSVVSKALEDAHLEPHLLELELTEGMVMENLDLVASRLDELRSLGISISIDDFGVGYSSLSYFRTLPVDKLKIDRAFIRDLMSEPVSRQRSLALSWRLWEWLKGFTFQWWQKGSKRSARN